MHLILQMYLKKNSRNDFKIIQKSSIKKHQLPSGGEGCLETFWIQFFWLK